MNYYKYIRKEGEWQKQDYYCKIVRKKIIIYKWEFKYYKIKLVNAMKDLALFVRNKRFNYIPVPGTQLLLLVVNLGLLTERL